MEATRQIFWNIDDRRYLYGLALISLLIFLLGVFNKVRNWNKGRPVLINDKLLRLKDLLVYFLNHKRVIKSRSRRRIHMAIFYGFWGLLLGTVVIALQDLFNLHLFFGARYLLLSLLLDLSGFWVMLGVFLSVYRRFVHNPDRLDKTADDAVTLVLLFCILFTGFLLEGLRIYATSDAWAPWSPVGLLLAATLAKLGLTGGQARSAYPFLWNLHMLLTLGFIAYIPYSKLFHIFASPLNIFLKPISASGVSLPSEISAPGTTTLRDFTQKQLIELDACVSCLRCEKHCPSRENGGPLSPSAMVQSLKKSAYKGLPFSASRKASFDSNLVGQNISKNSLLACTTCGICEQKCPMHIKHVARITGLRQSLGIGEYPEELQELFQNLASRGNPWGKPNNDAKRSELQPEVPYIREKDKTDILYWVGCFGSYESRGQQVTQAMFEVLRKAGIDFATLGPEANCCGEAVRRLGNEGLFQRLAKNNIAALNRSSFTTIITHCPHCYNTLKHEYPQLGGSYRVVHHSQFLLDLIESGQIKPMGGGKLTATYHDPCYLGRYNNIYRVPRKVLSAIEDLEVAEMQNNYAKSLCCGGGGGRIWFNEAEQNRINLIRAREVAATGADVVVSSCPLCLNNLSEAVNKLNPQMKNLDIAEIVNLRL